MSKILARINEKVVYQCPYCNKLHGSEIKAIKCLENHDNIIFEIYKEDVDYDCWGEPENHFVSIGKLFKRYSDAIKYIDGHDEYYKIYIRELY